MQNFQKIFFTASVPYHICIIHYQLDKRIVIWNCLRGRRLLILLRTPILFESFLQRFSTWHVKVISLSRSRPSNFAVSTCSRMHPFDVVKDRYLSWGPIFPDKRFPVTRRDFVFNSFSSILFALAQVSTSSYAWFNLLRRSLPMASISAEDIRGGGYHRHTDQFQHQQTECEVANH